MKISHADLVAQAMAEIETWSPHDAQQHLGDSGVSFIDLRDRRELEREGRIPGAVHAPRGMLEFWVDPSSPYFRDVFGSGNRFVLYCQSGWRSALATHTLVHMGLEPVCHIGGGFRAWVDAGLPTEAVERK